MPENDNETPFRPRKWQRKPMTWTTLGGAQITLQRWQSNEPMRLAAFSVARRQLALAVQENNKKPKKRKSAAA